MKTKRNAVQGRLFALFDYQRIAENPRLAKMIEDTEARYGAALSDDSLEFVSAAGETFLKRKAKAGKRNDEHAVRQGKSVSRLSR